MAALEQDFFEAMAQEQKLRQPDQVDANQWSARWIFVPFRDRPLPVDHMQNFGLPYGLKAGWLIPLTKFSQPVLDNGQVLKVPTARDGTFLPSPDGEGINRMIPIPRAPYRVMQGIFRVFNPNKGDAINDNGICEIEPLFSIEDMVLVRRIQLACLPQRYATAREQLVQLERAASESGDSLTQKVAERLYQATVQAKRHVEWHCQHAVEAALENPKRTGKEELSELDHACYAWLERPEPKKRSLLTDQQQAIIVQTPSQQVMPSVPQVQCESCGTFVNLLASGLPPAFCVGCQKPFPKPTPEEIQAALDESEGRSAAALKREQKAADMRQRMKG